jgi:hypothetical protein
VQFGRQGKLFLRGFFEEDNLDSAAGEWTVANQSGLNTNMQGLITSSGLSSYINLTGVVPAYALVLASIKLVDMGGFSQEQTETRYVTGLELAGVAWNKMSHNPRRAIP